MRHKPAFTWRNHPELLRLCSQGRIRFNLTDIFGVEIIDGDGDDAVVGVGLARSSPAAGSRRSSNLGSSATLKTQRNLSGSMSWRLYDQGLTLTMVIAGLLRATAQRPLRTSLRGFRH